MEELECACLIDVHSMLLMFVLANGRGCQNRRLHCKIHEPLITVPAAFHFHRTFLSHFVIRFVAFRHMTIHSVRMLVFSECKEPPSRGRCALWIEPKAVREDRDQHFSVVSPELGISSTQSIHAGCQCHEQNRRTTGSSFYRPGSYCVQCLVNTTVLAILQTSRMTV